MPDVKTKDSRSRYEMTVDELAEKLREAGLAPTDTVLVQSSFIPFRRIVGGPKAVIEALLNILSPQGTLIMPAFNWEDFGQKKLYSKISTKPQTGILSELLTRWKGVCRIYHPIHGFTLLGAQAESLAQKVQNRSSFESSSLFGELHRMNAKLMLLGVPYRDGFTFFHYVEESVGVPYRKFIDLQGRVEELDGTVREMSLPYYGRNSLKLRYDLDKVEPFLEDPGAPLVKKTRIGMAAVRIMRAKCVYDRLAEVLKKDPNLVIVNGLNP